MRKLMLILFPLMLACGGGGDKVNVILVIVDTLRADRIGCYGAANMDTPTFDRLAGSGVRFDAAFTQAPFTLPSIASILTSLYPYRHQVRNNQTNLDESYTTLAEIFRKEGYRTAAVLGSAVLDGERNLSQGFDYYDDQFPENMEVYSEQLRAAKIPLGDRDQRRASDVTASAWNWLKDVGNEPFFLLVHYFDPHSKYDPPPPFKEKYGRRGYDGEVAYTDDEVGRLLEGLRSRGLDRTTLVALIGDHGEALGEHNEPEHGFFVYESTIRIPMILSLPGILPEGRVETALVRAIDLFPTITEIAGVKTPRSLDGNSLLPLIQGEAMKEVPVYSEAFLGYFGYGWSPTWSIRTRDWKLIEAPKSELYNLVDDPGETSNLYDTHPDQSERLEAILAEHHRREKEVEPLETSTGDIGEGQRKRLEALGYITRGNRSARDAFAELPDAKDGVQEFVQRQKAKNFANRGSAMLREGNREQGISTLREAIEFDPGNTGARHLLGAALLVYGENAEAESIYRDLIRDNPAEVEYRANLGVALTNQERTDEALVIFHECAKLSPDDERYPRLIAACNRALRDKVDFHINYQFDFARGR